MVAFAPAVAAEFPVPSSHPRLLIHPDDVAAIRMRCGVPPVGPAPAVRARFGTQRDALERLKDAAREIMNGVIRDGDLFAPALLHLIVGEPGRPDEYTRYITGALLAPERRLFEIDAIVALDWCWDALEEPARTRIIERLPVVPEAFDPTVSPLNHLRFNSRLCGLAAALVRYRSGPQEPAETNELERVIRAGREYLQGPWMEFLAQRGAMPTSGEQGIWEETDYCLALELLRSGLGIDLWPQAASSFGRSMEHYFYADTEYPGLEHGFIHDDGTEIPPAPGRVFRGFAPAVPWVLAARARDPVAIWYANRSLPRQGPIVPEVERYGWVRLVYGPLEDAEVDRRACPLARNFGGGWVAMRTGWAPGETVLLFDAGQPFWRSRQHFDAGQFQIYRKGRLAVQSGDDVTFQAVPAQQGRTIIGRRGGMLPATGDWDHYFRSTIAHNCVTVADPRHTQRLYGRPWISLGNQRLIGQNYDFSAGDLHKTGRETGRLTAFETNPFYSFAAADLTAAYPLEVVRAMRREVLLLHAGAVLVLDRVSATRRQSIKTWHLQLSAPPQVLASTAEPSAALASSVSEEIDPATDVSSLATPIGARQIHGVEANAGVWQLGEDQDWLAATHLGGRLFVRTLWPVNAVRRLAGGPMRPRQIPGGPFAGRTYFGGDPAGFEYRLWPASFLDAPSAAYELGRPTGLGPQFGVGATWGRLDVSPPEEMEEVVFLHLLIPTDATVETPPAFSFSEIEQMGKLDLTLGAQQISVSLSLAADGESSIQIRDESGQVLVNRRLTREIEPDEQLPRLRMRLP